MLRITSHNRRAVGYVATLLISAIVVVIGLSALTATRIQLRTVQTSNDVAAARFAAQSGIELALLELNQNPDLLLTCENDTWATPQSIGGSIYTWKLVSGGGDLIVSFKGAVRLHGMGVAGDAVRVYSVRVKRPDDEPASIDNLLTNGDIEDGLTGWEDLGQCDLAIATEDPHGGAACMHVQNRTYEWDGPLQDITTKIDIDTSYRLEVWAKTENFPEDVQLIVWLRNPSGWHQIEVASTQAATDWTHIEGTFDSSGYDPIYQVYFKVETGSSNQEFSIDDALLYVTSAGGLEELSLVPVYGSWRQEIGS
ncbi:MAG: carbohydrate binding domain-containing protein [Planctomycetota bacterium]